MDSNPCSAEPIPTPTVIPDFPLSAIEPNAANPRKITAEDEEALRASLRRFGLVGVLVVNERTDGRRVLVSGHQRMKALLAAGATTAPAILTKLSIHDETALGLQLNGHQGRFRDDALKAQLEALRQAGRDVRALGLHNEAAYRKAMDDLGELTQAAPPAKPDEEAAPEQTPAGPAMVTIGQFRFEITAAEHAKLQAEAAAAGSPAVEHAARKLGVA
jgi:ParB-like chromosome segregation protein Spo0J